jgi:hypothetical protein
MHGAVYRSMMNWLFVGQRSFYKAEVEEAVRVKPAVSHEYSGLLVSGWSFRK